MRKGKRAAAAYVHADCSNSSSPQHLFDLLAVLLNPRKAIDEWETIDWCKWLMAGGRTPDDFAGTGKVALYELYLHLPCITTVLEIIIMSFIYIYHASQLL
jgi:hypothetical protein